MPTGRQLVFDPCDGSAPELAAKLVVDRKHNVVEVAGWEMQILPGDENAIARLEGLAEAAGIPIKQRGGGGAGGAGRSFEVGDQLRCRDKGGEWQVRTVTGLDPLMADGFAWDEIEQVGGADGKPKRRQPAAKAERGPAADAAGADDGRRMRPFH
eukprot:gene14645-6925_t